MNEPVAVDPRAAVDPAAELDSGVRVAAFAVIGPRVRLGRGCRVGAHAIVLGDTWIGPDCAIFAHAVVGGPPQLRGEVVAGALRIGARNRLREFVTLHAGGGEGRITRLGDDNLLMAYAHVGHDCEIGSENEVANGVQLAGHVRVGDRAMLGGAAAVHQFVRIGDLAMVAAGARVAQDVPPFCLAAGDRARVYGLNSVGLRRRGLAPAARARIAGALRRLYDAPTLAVGLEAASEVGAGEPAVERLLSFARASRRGLCRAVWR